MPSTRCVGEVVLGMLSVIKHLSSSNIDDSAALLSRTKIKYTIEFSIRLGPEVVPVHDIIHSDDVISISIPRYEQFRIIDILVVSGHGTLSG